MRSGIPLPDVGRCEGNELSSQQLLSRIQRYATRYVRSGTRLTIASALGLLDTDETSNAPYGSLIQSFNRWLLATFSSEAIVDGETFAVRKPSMSTLSLGSKESAIDQVLGIRTRTTNACSSCDSVASREGTLHVIDIQYLRKVSYGSDNS